MELLTEHIDVFKEIRFRDENHLDFHLILQGVEKSNGSTSLFISRFHRTPNLQYFYNIDQEKCFNWFLEMYKNQIFDFQLQMHKSTGANTVSNCVFFFGEDMVMEINFSFQLILLNYKKTSLLEVQALIEEVNQFDLGKSPSTPIISLLTERSGQIETDQFVLNRPSLLIEEAYNADFIQIHKQIKGWIEDSQAKGLLLLHGKPGTGKTSYLKHLMGNVHQNFIYVPSDFFYCLSLPRFSSFLINHKNTVFVIEDAERLLIDRKADRSSEVSSILNLCDGFLADAYNIKIICTFNTNVVNIDKALLRKGRLFGIYEFKELEVEKCNQLSRKLAFNVNYDAPQLLTEVCNPQDLILNTQNNKTMGFELNLGDN